MKKLTALALALVMVLAASLSFAATLTPDRDILEHLDRATFHATVGAYNADDRTFTVRVCDYDRYDDDEVRRLAVGDTILAGGYLHVITGEQDIEDTHIFLCDGGEEIYFERSYDGDDDMIARSTMDDRIFMNEIAVLHLPVAEGAIFEDCSDPDLDAKPVITEGLEGILKVQAEKEQNSNGLNAYATTVTLNDKLEIVKIHQDYDVAQ